MPRQYKEGGSEDQSSRRQTPSPKLSQAALETRVQCVVQPVFRYLLVGVVVNEGLAGPPRQHSKWHPGQHKW